MYTLTLNTCIDEMRRRFSSDVLQVATSSEEFLCFNEEDSEFFIKAYSVPGTKLRNVKGRNVCIEKKNIESSVQRTASLKVLSNIQKKNVLRKDLKIFLTLLSNSATCEKSFPSMCCISCEPKMIFKFNFQNQTLLNVYTFIP